MKHQPVTRPRIYDLYWYFASERQRMFQRRVAGVPGPCTDDPILREFKFCNVFRAADRVSQYMIRDVCYHGEPCTEDDRLFQGTAFRTFSKIATWRTVRDILGRYPTLDDLADGSFGNALDHNYGELLDFSENDFTQAGPGALRGIKKCFEDLGGYTPAEVVQWMTERQDKEFARLGLPFGGLWGRPLYAIDCQGLFCETDKYCRQAAPELASAASGSRPASSLPPSRSACSSRQNGASTTYCPSSQCSQASRSRTHRNPYPDPPDRQS